MHPLTLFHTDSTPATGDLKLQDQSNSSWQHKRSPSQIMWIGPSVAWTRARLVRMWLRYGAGKHCFKPAGTLQSYPRPLSPASSVLFKTGVTLGSVSGDKGKAKDSWPTRQKGAQRLFARIMQMKYRRLLPKGIGHRTPLIAENLPVTSETRRRAEGDAIARCLSPCLPQFVC